MHLELNGSEFKVSAGGLTVELLPKEFALLQFLYRNRGRTFSREQLLDKVWPMEYPVERTVDDHIYRLRKKLRLLGGIDIKTIRGFGYSLAIPGSLAGVAVNPATNDPELRDTMREVFMKFHVYGQGTPCSPLPASRTSSATSWTRIILWLFILSRAIWSG